jgi:type II secretory pathway pseudopilin PulG
MQESGMDIEPETTQGKHAVSELLADQKAAKQRAAELAMKVAESQLKELRAKNQSNRVIAATVTKREFVNRLRSTATRGRIEVSAIFECFAFQDVFGDPDSNVDWGDGKRLYLYRCSDGAVQLEVRVIGSRVFLTGFSEF